MKPEAIFLDRDGVINKETWGYVKHPREFRLYPNTAKAIKLLNEKGIRVIVVSNQAGISKGFYNEEVLGEIHSLMKKRLKRQGAYLDGIYYCPHSEEEKCPCRKPSISMLKEAESLFGLNLKNCWVIGDKIQDIQMGKSAGCKTILVLTGYGRKMLEDKENWEFKPDIIAKNLHQAVKLGCGIWK